MSPRPLQSSLDRGTYIPPEIAKAMDRQMQQMPANLRQYTDSDRPAYVPTGMDKTITQAMERAMPAHLSQYAGAYVQQKIMDPNVSNSRTTNLEAAQANPHPPIPNLLRRDHSMYAGEQHTVELNALPGASQNLFNSDSTQSVSQQPQTLTSSNIPQQNVPQAPNYDFLSNQETNSSPPSFIPKIPGNGSRLSRILVIAGGLILLIIIFSVAKNLFKGPTYVPSFLAVALDQDELLHIATGASQERDLSVANANFVNTAELSLVSSENALTKYLASNKHNLSKKALSLKISSATDADLANAESSGTFNSTFVQTITTQINNYLHDLNTAYGADKGTLGRKLLKSDYTQAQLFIVQINSPSST